MRAADPKAPDKLIIFEYRNGVVTRAMSNAHDVAGMLGDGPDWRWDLALLTPEVIDRLPALTERAIKAHPKPNAVLIGFDFTKDKPFYPGNTEPLIEIKTEAEKDVESAVFRFLRPDAEVVSGPQRSRAYSSETTCRRATTPTSMAANIPKTGRRSSPPARAGSTAIPETSRAAARSNISTAATPT